jgi:V/A-type H+-transporting ATPase subunit F
MDGKIAALGEKDIMLIFKAAGIDVFPVEDNSGESGRAGAAKKLKELADSGYEIVFITESMALKLDSIIKEYEDSPRPSIVVIPGPGERNYYAMESLRRIIIKAVGADILSDKAGKKGDTG